MGPADHARLRRLRARRRSSSVAAVRELARPTASTSRLAFEDDRRNVDDVPREGRALRLHPLRLLRVGTVRCGRLVRVGRLCSTRPKRKCAGPGPTICTRKRSRRCCSRTPHADEPRPKFESHGAYAFAVMLIPVVVKEEDRVVYYREIDVLLAHEHVLTVRKTPPDGSALDLAEIQPCVVPVYRRAWWRLTSSTTWPRGTSTWSTTCTRRSTSSRTNVDDWDNDTIRRRLSGPAPRPARTSGARSRRPRCRSRRHRRPRRTRRRRRAVSSRRRAELRRCPRQAAPRD